MLCQNCQERAANVHFTQIINNQKTELYLCEQCAKERGQLDMGAPFSFNDFLTGLIGFGDTAPHIQSEHKSQNVCEKCGMSYDEFQKTGRMGCENCYKTFAERITPVIKRLHGSTQHNGKMPVKVSDTIKVTNEIEKLKDQLNKAIQSEEYERAAEIRDQIRGLEAGSKPNQ